ncbi:kinase-like domain-containing protein [Cristinia sonorae]|uniref:Kinase-like domain-containing protein n=1 Tax=Cristinia sonorae TaxID=1940300 RepID=A0A8K0UEW4_9AGAR|nr:kinase-like domain-containing protein [Cristinia sonorae]
MHPHANSPPFGYLSPPTDSGDDASDDGDDIQTPLTEHSHQPYAVYQQQNYAFSSPPFQSYSPPDSHHSRNAFVPNQAKHDQEHSSFSSLLTPAAADKPAPHTMDSFFPYSSPPPNALDLANASLEFDPFAASFGESMSSQSPSNGLDRYSASSSPSNDSPTPLDLPPLPALTPLARPSMFRASQSENIFIQKGRTYSPRFPEHHLLNSFFVHTYLLEDELGAGGYGFVMTARHLERGHEVAVKFIIKDKVPDHCWWQDEILGRVPTEVLVMSLLNHRHVVKCLDLFEDDLYFYLVQELHGTPWLSRKSKRGKQMTAPGTLAAPSPQTATPSLTPSPSGESESSLLETPPQLHVEYTDHASSSSSPDVVACPGSGTPSPLSTSSLLSGPRCEQGRSEETLLRPEPRPNFSRRPSYDLFECIEQSKHKRLSEGQARYIFAQVVEAVYYLDSQGITHCDIKDENLVVDKDLNVKLIDFGSAVVADPSEPRPYYTLFFGTTAYAASEILQKKPYLAPPAEIWTLGVLLSYLLTGNSPFPTEKDAIDAHIVIKESMSGKLSRSSVELMQRCLDKDPKRRATIAEVREHIWLKSALDSGVVREE